VLTGKNIIMMIVSYRNLNRGGKVKKILLASLLSIIAIGILAVPAMAAAQKVDLVACPLNYPGATQPPGGAFVVFNNSAGPNNLEMTVALKGVLPSTEYDIYLGVDSWGTPGKVGTVLTNPKGNANFHLNTAVGVSAEHTLAVDITLKGSGSDIYETEGIHAGPMGGVVLTFK
jgi:hypothetical protein